MFLIPFSFKKTFFFEHDTVGNKPEQSRDVMFSSSNQVLATWQKSCTWNSDGFLRILKYGLTTRVSEIAFINDLRTCSSDESTYAVEQVIVLDSSRSKFLEV